MAITVITATTWMMTGPQLITICIDQAILVTSRVRSENELTGLKRSPRRNPAFKGIDSEF